MSAEHLRTIGVPERVIRALDPAVFRETDAVRLAREWKETRAGVVVFAGVVGAGKSVAAGWLLQHNVEVHQARDPRDGEVVLRTTRRSGAWVAASALAEASDFAAEFWGPLRRVDLLVVDEAGTERLDAKGRALGNFTELLRRRYDDGRRTVVTTNLPPSAWLKAYADGDGGRLRDRMAEAETDFGRSPIVVLTGASLRGGAKR